MTTYEIIEKRELIRLKNICYNWIIDSCYSPNKINSYKKLIKDCSNIKELISTSRSINSEFDNHGGYGYICNLHAYLYSLGKV